MEGCDANVTASAAFAGTQLPIARYRFHFRMRAPLRLPEYAGSLLRGQFGSALRRTACITRARTCAGCPLLATCPYPAIFETPAPPEHRLQKFSAVPNPYVIEPPPLDTREVAAGETLTFGMVLIGQALQRLPLVVYALQRALREGLGKERAPGDLVDIEWEGADGVESVWDVAAGRVHAHEAALPVPAFDGAAHATLTIATPLRLQDNGRPLRPQELSPRKLIMALVRRAELVLEFHADRPGLGAQAPALARHAESLQDERDLRWHDWSRYSSRQRQSMTLGGVLGTWTLRGELGPVLPWLWLGQWLHVGKNATMGLGGYTLRVATAC
ncbi:MAG: CRISPR system precrRNA processing endoribonuclease RAMP protein Cas6 [Burkholderiaceae bacterium]